MVIFTTQHVNAKNVTANFVCLYLFDHERKKERMKEIHYLLEFCRVRLVFPPLVSVYG